jgi:hypothetical protein
MTWSDPIVEEVRKARQAYAARFNYDLRAIYQDLKKQEKRSGRKVVSYAKDSSGIEPSEAHQRTASTTKPSDSIPSQEPGSVAQLHR